jgi:outer membrane receptor protein involved in Fe transport
MRRHFATAALAAATLLAALPAAAEDTAGAAAAGNDGAAPATSDATASAAPATTPAEDEPAASFFAATTVTALGREVDAFEITTPVTVIPKLRIERQLPNNAADLLRDEPGVDVNGVGFNQARPVIRGQRGLRVLFLEDGLRLNNARRQTDFGEITGLVDTGDLRAVEVVRGPMSVLYGSDAVGGVLNVLTKAPTFAEGSRFGGEAEARWGEAGDLTRFHAGVRFQAGKLRTLLSASTRSADDYRSASGSFGDLRLEDSARVIDSGVDDDSLFGVLSWDLDASNVLTLRHRSYRADQTGFGFVDPALIGDDSGFRIRILYPYQDFDRTSLEWSGSAVDLPVADSVQVQVYHQENDRELANDIDIDIGPIFPGAPPSSVESDSLNRSVLDTWGLRAEAIVGLPFQQLLTYGFEGFRDQSDNTDRSVTTTTIRFPFPPFEMVDVSEDTVPNAPNAENTSWGLFVQDEIPFGKRVKATLGARYQKVETRAESTPGWEVGGLDFSDHEVVGTANLLFQATDNLNVFASWGSAFRAPNIIERLFNGATPEGAGYQILNSDLTSETSDNYDVGIKYRRREAYFEAVWFRNDLENGIVQDFLSPAEIAALPESVRDAIDASGAQFVVQQRNLDRLRYEGFEVALGYRAPFGLSLGANYTHLEDERIGISAAPVENQYADKIAAFLRYEPDSRRWWAEYRIRHNGGDDVVLDEGEPAPPIGDRLPAFTVHSVGAGVLLFERGRQSHSLTVQIVNLTDELYAEFSNATFFRPEAGRNVVASYRVSF